MDKKELLVCDQFYYINNHVSDKDSLFYNEQNYSTFLKLFGEYILPIANLYGYCLLPKQFHFLIKIKDEKTVFNYFRMEGKFPDANENLSTLKQLSNAEGLDNLDVIRLHLSKQVTSFLNAYSKLINAQEKRRGNLFEQAFKRNLLTSEKDIKHCLIQIHQLPIHQKIATQISDWKYVSYTAFLSDKPTKINREEVLTCFDGTTNFINHHNKVHENILLENQTN